MSKLVSRYAADVAVRNTEWAPALSEKKAGLKTHVFLWNEGHQKLKTKKLSAEKLQLGFRQPLMHHT